MITLTLFLVFYVVSAIVAYQTFRRNYSSGGSWEYLNPNLLDACIVFVPIVNWIICMIYLIDYLQETNSQSFFRIDKDEEIDEEEELRKETVAYNKWKSAHDRRRKKLQKN